MLKIYKNMVAGSFLSIIAILMFLSSFNIHKLAKSTIGSAFVPQLVSICMFLLSMCLVMNSLKDLHIYRKMKASKYLSLNKKLTPYGENPTLSVKKSFIERVNFKINFSLIQTFILLIIYVSFLKSIGFLIMTGIYLFIQFLILGDKPYKNIPLYLTIAIITTVSTYYLFTRIFYVMLPSGMLG